MFICSDQSQHRSSCGRLCLLGYFWWAGRDFLWGEEGWIKKSLISNEDNAPVCTCACVCTFVCMFQSEAGDVCYCCALSPSTNCPEEKLLELHPAHSCSTMRILLKVQLDRSAACRNGCFTHKDIYLSTWKSVQNADISREAWRQLSQGWPVWFLQRCAHVCVRVFWSRWTCHYALTWHLYL